mmetsp:Transcript_58832/g.187797  ORF Transcript_58832/g.187797 Transcript_58832/m.187797 type:complete len:248 (+) Transcript_58832:136-879(+)
MTSTRSESMMVLRRWAIVRMVQCLNSSRTTFWISLSLSTSTDAVASSIMSTGELRSSARAMQKSCLCPCEKLSPLSTTFMSSFSSDSSTTGLRPTRASEAQIFTSVYSPNGSMLVRTEPENMNGSCGIMAIALRSLCSPISLVSTPSRVTRPSNGSTMRKRARKSEDLPDPVRPQIPIFSPALMSRSRSLRTRGVSGRYRITSPDTLIAPRFGQPSGRELSPGRSAAASSGWGPSPVYSLTRSTPFI